MKAVVYHADARFDWGQDVGDVYQRLFPWFKAQCHAYGMDVIHLTLQGFPGWGDINIHYEGFNPADVMWNRELIFAQFLETAPDDIYWFTEPDCQIVERFPNLEADCSLLYRHGHNPSICPAWRLFRQKAHPIMRELADLVQTVELNENVRKDWHCDSASFHKFYKALDKPRGVGIIRHKEFDIELRHYHEYIKPGRYTRNYKGQSKLKFLEGL